MGIVAEKLLRLGFGQITVGSFAGFIFQRLQIQVPQDDAGIITATGQGLPVGTKGHTPHVIAMAFELI